MDVVEWLRGLGLEQYETAFREAEVGPDILSDLTDADLAELGVSLGNRKRLLKAIAALGGMPGPTPVSAPVPERRQLTVMFCDLVGSTEMSTRLDPEDMRDVIRAFQDVCSGAVARYDGFLARFMGDGVLAYFGFPRAHEEDAERAIRSGLDIVGAVGKLETPARRKLAVRVGIATGIVVVGDLIGQGAAQEQDVIGETPNLAARLQALADPGTVVIAESTKRLVGRTFELESLGIQLLKGFGTPVPVWSVLRDARNSTRFEALRWQGLSPLVNREVETTLLHDRWRRARDGEGGQVVLVTGEAGIGKSRIVAALADHVTASPHIAISYQCSPHHVNEALHPILSEIRRAAGMVSDDPDSTKLEKLEAMIARYALEAGEIAPLLAVALSIPTGDRYPPMDWTPAERKERTTAALIVLFAARSHRAPALALLEDAHWIDPTSLDVFGRLMEQLPGLNALLVVTARPEFTPTWGARENSSVLQINRLARAESIAVLQRVAGGKALPTGVLEEIIAKTDGVPLFVEELTKAVMESDLLREEGDAYQLVSAPTPMAIPSTLQDSLLARLDRLSSAKDVAQIGAAIGREFSHRILEEVSPVRGPALTEVLEMLVAADIIHRRGTPPDTIYTFKHALLRDAAYQLMVRSKRRDVHRGIAHVLETLFPQIIETQPEMAAYHYEHGGAPEQAADHYRLAGGRAAARSANVEAIAYLNEGLRVIESLPTGATRDRLELRLQLPRTAALRGTKGYAAPETGEAIQRAYALSQSVGEPAQLLLTLAGLYAYHVVRSETMLARDIAEELLAFARKQGDATYVMIGLRSVGCVQFQLGHQLVALDHFEQSLALYDPVVHGPLASSFGIDHKEVAASFRSTTLWLLGRPVQAEASQREALSHAENLKHLPSIDQALIYSALLRVMARDYSGVIEPATEALHLARRLSFAMMEHGASFFLAAARRGQAAPEALLQEMLNATGQWWATGAGQYRGYVLTIIAETYLDANQPEEGLSIVAEGKALLEVTNERWAEAELYRVEGMLLLALPERRIAEAEACLRKAMAVAREHSALSWELRAAVDLAGLLAELGGAAEGKALVEGVYRRFTEGFDSADLIAARAILTPAASVA